MLITEEIVRKEFSKGNITSKGELALSENEILTPSARSFLNEKNIIIRTAGAKETLAKPTQTEFTTIFGAKLKEKPEHMTHLTGNLLVFKNHPVIAFRGQIDYLESEIISAQVFAEKKGFNLIVSDLEEIIKFVQNLIRFEITGERVDEFKLIGLSATELREHSHSPSKHYGIKHFIPSYKQGEVVAILNRLRTITRQVELSAYNAFVDEYGNCKRDDIIRALNRLSSLFWIMMFKYLSKQYEQ